MVKKGRTSMREIHRVHIDRRQREAGYIMSSHHCHPYYEVCIVEQGSCRFLLEDLLYDLHEGDVLLIPPQIFHYTRYLFGPCRRFVIYFQPADVEAVAGLLPGDGHFFSQVELLHIPEPGREQLASLLSRMFSEDQLNDARSPMMLKLLLQELFLFCSRSGVFMKNAPAALRRADDQILSAARFINEHFRQPISSADIAAAAGFSPNYLSRKFRESAGIGIHEYLVFVRLRSAALELVTTDHSITYIATHCGFSDSNYFKDAFKKKYGVTPRQYRDEGRESSIGPKGRQKP